jgi:SAM-dependent methyltransferase
VLEVGCGPGDLWRANAERMPAIELTLSDLSPGMLEAARAAVGAERARFVEADAGALPFAEGSFDLVVANHMLYHVPERPEALRGLLRVLRPGGRLVASTNGAGHLEELAALTGHAAPRDFERFGLETGADQLREAGFVDVTVERYEDALEITEVEPVLAYVRSSIALRASDVELGEIGRRLARAIARGGCFRVGKSQGVIARPATLTQLW